MKPASFFLTIGFSLLLDAVAAGLVATLFGGTDKGGTFVLTFMFLVLAPALLGAWGLLKFWVSYALFVKGRLSQIYLAELNRHKMPGASGHYDATSYLNDVLEDATELPPVRAKAAFMLGELQAATSMKPFSLGIGANLAFEAAMSQYRRRPDMFTAMSRKAKIAAGITESQKQDLGEEET